MRKENMVIDTIKTAIEKKEINKEDIPALVNRINSENNLNISMEETKKLLEYYDKVNEKSQEEQQRNILSLDGVSQFTNEFGKRYIKVVNKNNDILILDFNQSISKDFIEEFMNRQNDNLLNSNDGDKNKNDIITSMKNDKIKHDVESLDSIKKDSLDFEKRQIYDFLILTFGEKASNIVANFNESIFLLKPNYTPFYVSRNRETGNYKIIGSDELNSTTIENSQINNDTTFTSNNSLETNILKELEITDFDELTKENSISANKLYDIIEYKEIFDKLSVEKQELIRTCYERKLQEEKISNMKRQQEQHKILKLVPNNKGNITILYIFTIIIICSLITGYIISLLITR